MSDETAAAISWWNSLSDQERFDHVFETWKTQNGEGKPEPKEKKKRERKPKLDLREVEDLAYRSKRGVITHRNDIKKIMVNFQNFGDMPEFKAAVMRGEARAISELLQGTVDEVMERLENHAQQGVNPT